MPIINAIRVTDENESTAYFLTKPTADIHYVNQTGDTMQGDLDMGNNKLKNAMMENCNYVPDMLL